MEYIKRAIENKLEEASKTFKAVLLTGARQAGKSTVLKKLFPGYRYVSLDDPAVLVWDNYRTNYSHNITFWSTGPVLEMIGRIKPIVCSKNGKTIKK